MRPLEPALSYPSERCQLFSIPLRPPSLIPLPLKLYAVVYTIIRNEGLNSVSRRYAFHPLIPLTSPFDATRKISHRCIVYYGIRGITLFLSPCNMILTRHPMPTEYRSWTERRVHASASLNPSPHSITWLLTVLGIYLDIYEEVIAVVHRWVSELTSILKSTTCSEGKLYSRLRISISTWCDGQTSY